MPIATPTQVKRKLGIDAADTSRDAEIADALEGVESQVLRRTRLSLIAEARVDEFTNIAVGELVTLSARPVDPAVPLLVEVRSWSDTTWQTIPGDLEDALWGRIRVIGEGLGFGWPPSDRQVPWARWRNARWPHLRVGYTTLVATITDELSDAAAVLASFVVRSGRGAGLLSQRAGQVEETYGSERASASATERIDAILAAYTPDLATASRR